MLTQVLPVSQDKLQDLLRFAIRAGNNLIVLGPAGGGKTQMCQQITEEMDFRYIYVDLSVLEAPDLVGLPTVSPDRKFVEYATPSFMPTVDSMGDDAKPVVMLFDEVDKAKPELQNPLLEILAERSINGRKLNVQACLLTGNLPDEGAFSQPISHALTNRSSVYKLELEYEAWQQWAVKAGVNPLVVGFLSKNPEFLHRPAPEGDPTAYCHPSPRAWTLAAKDLDKADGANVDFQTMLVSGRVGTGGSVKFRVWLDHYRHIEPMLDKLLASGACPPDMSIDKLIVMAISSVGAISSECRKQTALGKGKRDVPKVHKMVGHVFKWLSTVDTEFQIAAIKNALDISLIREWELTKAPHFMEVISKTHKAIDKK